MAKVTGIGGVFFKARSDEKALAAWYRDNLGVPVQDWGGASLEWAADEQVDGGATAWMLAKADSTWFAPSESSFMINYRVDDLEGMLAHLTSRGVPIQKGPEVHENGRFAWVVDPDGNKIELWEPKPEAK